MVRRTGSMKQSSSTTSAVSIENRQGLARLACLYLAASLLWIGLTAAGLILAEVSGAVAALLSAVSAGLLVVASTVLFFRWHAGTLRAVAELVGLPGDGGWGEPVDPAAAGAPRAGTADADDSSDGDADGNASRGLGHVAAVVPGALFRYQLFPDGRGRYLYLSDAISELYGSTPAELCGMEDAHPLLLKLLVPEDLPMLADSWLRARRGTRSWHCEYRVRHPRRGEIWVEGRAVASDAGGTLWYGFLADITARKHAEAELRQSEALCRVLVENNTDAVFLHATGGVIAEVNSAAEALLGYGTAELLGQTPALFDAGMSDPQEQQAIGLALQRGETLIFDREHRRKDGTIVPVEVRLKGFNSDGQMLAVSSVRDISDRKRRELALQASEKRFRQLADLVPGVVWCQRGSAPASYLSERWFEYTGLRDAEPDNLAKVIHPDDLQTVYARFQHAGQMGQPYRCEYRLRHIQDGEYRWFLAHAVPLPDAQSGVDEWFGLAMDVDDLKHSEAALREERDRFGHFAQGVPGILHTYRMSPDGQASYPYASPSLEAVLGLTREQLADFAVRPQDYIHADDLLRVALAVQESAQRLEVYRDLYRFRHPRKGEIWVEVQSAPVREADGSIVWHGIMSDATERSVAASRLADSERRYRQLADSIPQVVWTSGHDGTVDFLNRRALEYTGFSAVALSQFSWNSVIHPEDREMAQQCWDSSQRQERLLEVSLRLRRADGTYRWHMLRHTPMRDSRGTLRRWYGTSTDIDDLKQVELALRAERDRFTALVNTVPGVIFACHVHADGQRSLDFVAPQVADLMGIDAAVAQLDMQQLVQQIHPEDLPGVERDFAEATRSLRLWRSEFRAIHGQRGVLWVEGVAQPTALPDGGVLWQGFLADISERKRAEGALQQQLEMLRVLSAAAADFLGGTDARPLLPELFDRVAEQLGCEIYWQYRCTGDRLQLVFTRGLSDAEEESGRFLPVGELLCGVCAEQQAAIYVDYLQDSEDPKAKAAKSLGLRVYFANPLIVSGELVGTLCFGSRVKDTLTEAERSFASAFSQHVALAKARQASDEALRDSEERYRRLVQMLPVAVLVTSQGVVSFCNPAFVRLMDAADESGLLAVPLSSFVHPDYAESLTTRLASHGSAPESALELRLQRQDGSSIPVQIELTHFIQQGRPATMVAVLDLTERESALAARRRLEEQVWQAQKLEATGRLAGGVAHDFNNLLTIINGCCHLLLASSGLNEEQHEAVAGIEGASERAARLTKQLLALSRKALIEPRVLDLNAVVSDSTQLLRRLLGEDIALSSKLDPLLLRIKADPGQIDQVLLNLAVNSRDAMPQGGVLSLETGNIYIGPDDSEHYPELRPGPYVRLSVSDNGQGIPTDVIANIFEPFFTTKPAGRGTGLGLAVVHGIVKQSGGHISVYSEVGVGTTFMLLLPALPVASARAPRSVIAADAPRGNETILLVDDEPEVRRLAKLSLSLHGYNVLEAANGEDALRIADKQAEPIHLLVTDLVMPLMGGRLLAHTLRQKLVHLRVLFMSGFTDDSVVRHGLLDTAEAFMQKPFTPTILAQQVRSLLDRRPTNLRSE